jgi:hypothetical protein
MLASGLNLRNMRDAATGRTRCGSTTTARRSRRPRPRRCSCSTARTRCVGQMPFQTYRPTPLQKQMVGIGEIEPIEHLSRELDTLRSMMLDAGIIAMCAGYAYDTAAIDEDDLVFGPARRSRSTTPGRRTRSGRCPSPSCRSRLPERQAIMADIERVTGRQRRARRRRRRVDLDGDRGAAGAGVAVEARRAEVPPVRGRGLPQRRRGVPGAQPADDPSAT